MKEVKFILTMFWGAALTTFWFLPFVADVRQLIVLPILTSLVTAIVGIWYLIDNWNNS